MSFDPSADSDPRGQPDGRSPAPRISVENLGEPIRLSNVRLSGFSLENAKQGQTALVFSLALESDSGTPLTRRRVDQTP
jgi:hypothetical protein